MYIYFEFICMILKYRLREDEVNFEDAPAFIKQNFFNTNLKVQKPYLHLHHFQMLDKLYISNFRVLKLKHQRNIILKFNS